jgi:transposase-like protein
MTEHQQAALAAYRKGGTYCEAARILGIAPCSVRRLVRKARRRRRGWP